MNPLAYGKPGDWRGMRVPATVLMKLPTDAARDPAGRDLAAACVAGDADARRRLQEMLWPLIADVLRAAGQSPTTDPGELLAYALDKDRVYRRLRTYEGRVRLDSYLRKYVLRHLLLQLIGERERRALRTVPLDEATADAEAPLDEPMAAAAADGSLRQVIQELSPERRLLLKLLHIEDFDLDDDECVLLARRARRSRAEVDRAIERARAAVRAREAERRERFDKAALVASSIQRHEERLRQAEERLRERGADPVATDTLETGRKEVESKLEWRRRQHRALLDESRRAAVTLPYREIAALMSMPIGTVTSELTRIRRELRQRLSIARGEKGDA